MNQRVKQSLVLLFVAFMLNASVADAAWTQEQGRCYVKVWARAMVGAGVYDAPGPRDMRFGVVDYRDISAQLYAECGIHPRLTLVAFGAPIGYAWAAGTGGAYSGPMGLGLRFDPLGSGGPTRFALQANYAYAPRFGNEVLYEEPGSSPRLFYQPALENHYGELQALVGHGWRVNESVTAWFSGVAGVRLNSAAAMTAALVANLQLGFTFSEWFQFEMHMPIYEPFGRAITETNIAGVGQTRYVGLGFGFSFWLAESFAIMAGFEGVFMATSNAATPTLLLGIESRFRAWGDD